VLKIATFGTTQTVTNRARARFLLQLARYLAHAIAEQTHPDTTAMARAKPSRQIQCLLLCRKERLVDLQKNGQKVLKIPIFKHS
jgi:hypothetical protein